MRHRLHPLARKSADHLALDAGRVRQRPKQVEDGAGAEFDPRRADVLHGRVMRGCEHETDAGVADASAHLLGVEIDLDAERLQHVGGSRFRRQRAVAVLGDWHAGAGNHEGRASRDVVGTRGVTTGAHHVDRLRRRLHAQHLGAHGGHRAGDLVDGFAAHAQAHQQRAHLRGCRFARHHAVEGGGRFFARQAGAGRHLGDKRLEIVGHGFPPCYSAACMGVRCRPVLAFQAAAISRKFFSIR